MNDDNSIKASPDFVFIGGEPAAPTAQEAAAMKQWCESGTVPVSYAQSVSEGTLAVGPAGERGLQAAEYRSLNLG